MKVFVIEYYIGSGLIRPPLPSGDGLNDHKEVYFNGKEDLFLRNALRS